MYSPSFLLLFRIKTCKTFQMFPSFLTPVLTQLFFPKAQTTFLTCFSRGEKRKYPGKKVPLNQGSKSQPPGHESDTLTTEPTGQVDSPNLNACRRQILLFQKVKFVFESSKNIVPKEENSGYHHFLLSSQWFHKDLFTYS